MQNFLHSLFIPALIGIVIIAAGYLMLRHMLRASAGTAAHQAPSHILLRCIHEYYHRFFTIVSSATAVFVIAIILLLPLHGWLAALCFVVGVLSSMLALYLTITISIHAQSRTAQAAQHSLASAFNIARSAGSSASLITLGILITSFSLLLWYLLTINTLQLAPAIHLLIGFAGGSALVALLARLLGGIFAKGANLGADLITRHDHLQSDDARNPAALADSAGDLAGNAAGATAELYSQLTVAAVAILTLAIDTIGGRDGSPAAGALQMPLILLIVTAIALCIGSIVARQEEHHGLLRGWYAALISAAGSAAALGGALVWWLTGSRALFIALLIGIVVALIMLLIAEYFTSPHQRPVQRLTAQAHDGAGMVVIMGLGNSMVAALLFGIVAAGAVLTGFTAGKMFGVAIVSMGLLTLGGLILAMQVFGAVADTALAIAHTTRSSALARERLLRLDHAGNTLSVATKSFALISAALSSVVLMQIFQNTLYAYFPSSFATISLSDPRSLGGIILGIGSIFALSGLTMLGSLHAARSLYHEVLRQLNDITGLKTGKANPLYERAVAVLTHASLHRTIPIILLMLVLPTATAWLLGMQGLSGYLFGAVGAGVILSFTLAVSGSSWDTARSSLHSSKVPPDTAEALLAGDMVGDAAKDAAAPMLSSLIIVLLLLAILAGTRYAGWGGIL